MTQIISCANKSEQSEQSVLLNIWIILWT